MIRRKETAIRLGMEGRMGCGEVRIKGVSGDELGYSVVEE